MSVKSERVPIATASDVSRLHVSALLDSLSDGVFCFDADWAYTYVNSAGCRFLNRSHDELVGRNCWELFPEFRFTENGQVVQRIMRERKAATWDYYSNIADTWAQCSAYPMPDGGIAVIFHSLDAHARAERAHHDSERRFRALADLVPAVIWTADALGQLTWVNQRWLEYSGETLEAAHNSTFASVHPEDRDRALAALREATAGKSAARIEYRLRRHDGAYRWHLTRVQPILDERGKLSYWLGSATDIQAEREMLAAERDARREAEEMRERLARVLAQAPFAVAITSGPQHILKNANERQLRLFGYRATLNLTLREAFPEKELEPVHEQFDRAFHQRETVVKREQRIGWDRSGTGEIDYGYFDLLYQPLTDEHGCVEGLLCVSTEVTESVNARLAVTQARDDAEAARRELERAHAQLEARIAERTLELAQSNQALAAEIVVRRDAEAARNDLQRRLHSAREDEQRRTSRDLHDQVGQTVTALMLAIKAACEAEPLPSATLTRLEDALKLAEDLGREIHEIATRLRPAVLDAFGLHAALRQLLADWSQRYGASVDFEAEWLKNQRFPADIETTLYRVTQEALTNVARHARARHVSVVVELTAGNLIAVVEDDGVGFSVAAHESGRMGLVGMRERVTLVGGTLDVESTFGTGTTVIVSLPISSEVV